MNRLPPHSIEAEESILSICLMGDAHQACVELEPHEFYRTAHQHIFNSIKALNENSDNIDLVSVVNHLRSESKLDECGGAAYLSKLIDTVPSPESILTYCTIIKEKYIKRQLIAQHSKIMNSCFDDKPCDVIAEEHHRLMSIEMPSDQNTVLRQVERWASAAPGEFNVTDIDRDLKFTEPYQKSLRTKACERLIQEGSLERSGNRRGWYRPRENDLVCQDFIGCEDRPVNLWLPFELNQKVDVFERNIITLGGEKNAGKTSLMLNIAWCNRNAYQVHYYNSEMGDQELKRRLMKFENADLREWSKIRFYERARNFSDVIMSGPNDLNIIDFLELSDEFWKVGQFVRDIHDNLGRAMAVIAIQKKTGADNPRGGEFVKEKSRLHLDLSNESGSEYRHKLKINPGKNWHTDKNPNGLYVKFKIVQGNVLIPIRDYDGNIAWFDDKKTNKAKTI